MNVHIPIVSRHIPKIIIGLICIEIVFAGIYLLDFFNGHPYWQICEFFDLDREHNIPTWFSSVQLFMIGYIALLVCSQSYYKAPPSRTGLTVFGLGFIFLSLDEASAIHEKLTYAFHDNPFVPYFNGLHGIWIVVYGSIAILLIIIFHRDIGAVWKTYRKESLVLLFGLIIYLAGAGGAETVTFFHIDKSDPIIYTIEVIVEEFLEMAGATILLGGVLMLASKKLN